MVTALLVEQFLVGTLLNDLALRKQDDIVGVLNGGQPVGDHQHSADVLHLFQGVLNEHFRFGVDVGQWYGQSLIAAAGRRRSCCPAPGQAHQGPFPGG